MQYGFLIDHDKCIGCHACTVACKSENEVPVGSFRTWVKYTERGAFPDVKRHFAVLRCNHCTDAPCVTICPVNALEKRGDGIVDIDRDACIGCRACMQGCPYDAIYLNEDHGKVEKCHFCAHRVERGLEPACAVVCPEEAIIAGDLDDPGSKISLLVANNPTEVRRPEQGTSPNVHYKGVDPVSLKPGAAERPPTYIWSDKPDHKPEPWPASVVPEPAARTVLDVHHHVEWGWPVAAYLVTKGIAAGAAMLAPFLSTAILPGNLFRFAPEVIALLFTMVTGALLAGDLKHPLLFVRLFTRPNWRSWLVRGAIVLNAFIGLLVAGIALRLAGADGAADVVRWINAPLGIAAACYTAPLLWQCKGRDLWESRWLLPHLFFQAVLCGAAALLPFADAQGVLVVCLAIGIVGHGVLALIERYRAHPTDNGKQAAGFLGEVRIGPLRAYRDGLILGVIVALLLLPFLPVVAAVLALAGLLFYEHAFIRAGQLPPLA